MSSQRKGLKKRVLEGSTEEDQCGYTFLVMGM